MAASEQQAIFLPVYMHSHTHTHTHTRTHTHTEAKLSSPTTVEHTKRAAAYTLNKPVCTQQSSLKKGHALSLIRTQDRVRRRAEHPCVHVHSVTHQSLSRWWPYTVSPSENNIPHDTTYDRLWGS